MGMDGINSSSRRLRIEIPVIYIKENKFQKAKIPLKTIKT